MKPGNKQNLKYKGFYILAPFILLTTCIITINIANWWTHREPTSSLNIETSESVELVSVTTQSVPTATAVPPTPPPTPTPYIPPQFSPETIIRLLGPPVNGTFAMQQPINLYWEWSQPLTEDQFFAIFLQSETETQQVGTVTEANLGTQFQWQLHPNDLLNDATTATWEIHLLSQYVEQPLLISERRAITIR